MQLSMLMPVVLGCTHALARKPLAHTVRVMVSRSAGGRDIGIGKS